MNEFKIGDICIIYEGHDFGYISDTVEIMRVHDTFCLCRFTVDPRYGCTAVTNYLKTSLIPTGLSTAEPVIDAVTAARLAELAWVRHGLKLALAKATDALVKAELIIEIAAIDRRARKLKGELQ